MDTNIVEVINETREVAWLPWAVQYFFLIGLSVGGVLLSLPGYAFAKEEWRRLGRVALLVALTCGLAAPVALLSDLHQPGRFWHFYVVFRPTSWMWWGSGFIPFYVIGLLAYAWACFREEFHEQGRVDSRLGTLYRLAALGGAMYPLELFPDTMRTISRFTPHAWAYEALADIQRRGAGLADVLPELGVLAAIGVLLVVLGGWSLRRSLARSV